ncbi:preA [Symbiodinium pilosum]|uniref:PreA protein n=1 Tax=Symbiodinium pilosum TaxID=2952 RepID=A0A812P193_SYMPI|nr:preA [Symbiodinium pilosum]
MGERETFNSLFKRELWLFARRSTDSPKAGYWNPGVRQLKQCGLLSVGVKILVDLVQTEDIQREKKLFNEHGTPPSPDSDSFGILCWHLGDQDDPELKIQVNSYIDEDSADSEFRDDRALQFVKELRLKKLANESSEASAKPETREPEPAKPATPATAAKPAAPAAPAAAIVLAEALQSRSKEHRQQLKKADGIFEEGERSESKGSLAEAQRLYVSASQMVMKVITLEQYKNNDLREILAARNKVTEYVNRSDKLTEKLQSEKRENRKSEGRASRSRRRRSPEDSSRRGSREDRRDHRDRGRASYHHRRDDRREERRDDRRDERARSRDGLRAKAGAGKADRSRSRDTRREDTSRASHAASSRDRTQDSTAPIVETAEATRPKGMPAQRPASLDPATPAPEQPKKDVRIMTEKDLLVIRRDRWQRATAKELPFRRTIGAVATTFQEDLSFAAGETGRKSGWAGVQLKQPQLIAAHVNKKRMRFAGLRLLLAFLLANAAAQTTDGGRSELPGMKKDIFDQMKDAKNKGQSGAQPAKRADCPKSDQLSPFRAFCIVQGEIFVKFNDTDDKCRKIVSVGGANTSALFAASRTCGAAGEWKRRVAEELSAVYFVGGWEEWPKSEGEPVEVELEDGNFSVPITAENYEVIKDCWARGCGCEQAANPKMKGVLWSLLAICVFGIGWDGIKLTWEKISGGKKKDKDKKDKKEKKSKKGDDEVTGDESTETKSEKDDGDDKSAKDTDAEGREKDDGKDDKESENATDADKNE